MRAGGKKVDLYFKKNDFGREVCVLLVTFDRSPEPSQPGGRGRRALPFLHPGMQSHCNTCMHTTPEYVLTVD